ncbi:hypothetical protein [Kordiimonas pumila]|uniref:PEP-CTERM protein-sorting domain-containing protein n=1 Tax=Kordiimonas pumila TaxID=2161677 RepID=A0ABV7D1Q6_9PROT|nr:hypothetical protein [Kordiimonas pumila]
MKNFGFLIKSTCCAALVAFASIGAKATYHYYDISADAGSYSPIVLGEDLQLDACGSDVHQAVAVGYTSNEVYNICSEIPSYSIFGLRWEITFNNVTQVIGEYLSHNMANGLSISVATGAGTLISQAGSYSIGLWVGFADNSSFSLPCYAPYSVGYTGDDSGYIQSQSGYRNLDYDTASLSVTAPAAVPEPAAAFLLLPALIILSRRQRKLQKAGRA